MSGALAIIPSAINGQLEAPPSKSSAHRAVIAAALAPGKSAVAGLELSEDISATLDAVRALGAEVALTPACERQDAVITGIRCGADMPLIDCRESGSTLRFMLPVALAVASGAVFTGSVRLAQRPLAPYLDVFNRQGITVAWGDGGFPLTVRGKLLPGEFSIPGNISSQFITGLMLAAPALGGGTRICVEGGLESADYVRITMGVLERFGVRAVEEEPGKRYFIAGGQAYRACRYDVEGDWSQAAFPLLMGLLGGEARIHGLNPDSRQGDRVIESIFREMGGDIRWDGGLIAARKSSLNGIDVDVSQCPDLAPAIAAALAVAGGAGRITGGARLRAKESDRIRSVTACLNALGADVTETDDGMLIAGKPALAGGNADACNDHRIAMMAAAVSPACSAPVTLTGWQSVAKSWPGFWNDIKVLGGKTNE